MSGFADFDWNTKKLSDANIGLFSIHGGNRSAFTFAPNFKEEGDHLRSGSFDWRLIFKASPNTDFGFAYKFRINKPDFCMRLGF